MNPEYGNFIKEHGAYLEGKYENGIHNFKYCARDFRK
jgi:hypothetical protein